MVNDPNQTLAAYHAVSRRVRLFHEPARHRPDGSRAHQQSPPELDLGFEELRGAGALRVAVVQVDAGEVEVCGGRVGSLAQVTQDGVHGPPVAVRSLEGGALLRSLDRTAESLQDLREGVARARIVRGGTRSSRGMPAYTDITDRELLAL